MPRALELKLKKQVANKNWSKERKNAFVFGTMRKTGWVPSTQKKSSGVMGAMKRKLRGKNV